MSPVRFKEWQCHDDRPELTQEDSVKRALAFAGIHYTSFLDWILEAFDVTTSMVSEISDLGDWEAEEGSWGTYGGVLIGIGGGNPNLWYKVRHTTEVELGFVATFDKTGNRGAFIVCSNDGYEGYLVWWAATAVGISDLDGATVTTLSWLPCAHTGNATVTVAVWPQRYTSIDVIDDLTISLWFDDKLLISYTVPHDSAKGKKIGFGVAGADRITFDNLRVAQLHQITEWTSVDPGEVPAASLSRTVGQDEIFLHGRYDGTIKVWRNTETDSDWTVEAGRPVMTAEVRQIFSPSHFRLLGALHEIDVFRDGTQGHIFGLGDDPNALSEEATYDRALRKHLLVAEDGRRFQIFMAPNVVLEPEDIITYGAEKWYVTSVSLRIRRHDKSYALTSVVEVRQYLDA